MKYVCLLYVEESAFDPLSEADRAKLDKDSVNFDVDLKNRGLLVVAAALQPPATRDDDQRPRRQDDDDRWALRGNQNRRRGANACCRARLDRGAADDGHRAAGGDVTADIDALYRAGSRRVLATLIRLLGSFELAKEALHDAFAAAAEPELDPATIADDQLRLIFVCCHPALSPEARVALTLREVCALTTEEIARAFLTSGPALAQRIVRAKAKIRDAGIPYEVPDRPQLPERLAGVLQVVYLVFNEGYSASAGATVVRHELAAEAIRLGRLLIQLLPEPEAIGLLALMLLHDSRRHARASPDGDLVLLPEQDRTRWDHAQIAEGLVLAHRVMAVQPSAPYAIQAAIAAAHARAATAEMTDWAEIARLYDLLFAAVPSPIVALNRAVAVAMRDGPEAGLVLIDALLEGDELARYHLAHSARADLLRRLGRREAAKVAYERALALATQAPERRFLLKQMGRLVG